MKKKNAMLMILVMTSTVIFAQRHNVDPQARAEKFNDYMKKELSLSDDQYSKVKVINQTFGERFRNIRKDSTVTREASRTEMKKIHEEHNTALKGVLTEKQYAQWTALKANHAGMGKGDHASRAEHMKKELALNDDQYSKVKAIDKTFADRFKNLRKDSSMTKETSHTEFKKIHEERNSAIKGVLTSEQYNKWISMKEKKKHGDRKKKGTTAPTSPDNNKG